ncbi:MAG: RNA polymerase sigma factor [Putridiphycobacter sp.]
MNHYSDKELIELYKNDGSFGFQQIVKQFQERVYWQIRRLTKNHQDTEDVMQNVFIKVWKALPNFKGDSAIYTWLYRIAFNETHTFLTKQNKRRQIDGDPPLFEKMTANQTALFLTEGKELSGEEIEKILFQAIDTLPEMQQHVFRLRYLDDLKFKEVASYLNLSEGGVKANYHHAVKKIEEFIKGY